MKWFERYPLQKKILVSVSVLVFLPYLILSYFLSAYLNKAEEHQKREQIFSLLHTAELAIDRNLAQVESTIDMLANFSSIQDALRGKNRNEEALSYLYHAKEEVNKSTSILRMNDAEIYLITLNPDAFEIYNLYYRISQFENDREINALMDGNYLSAWLSPHTGTGEMPLYTRTGEYVLPYCCKVFRFMDPIGLVMCSVNAESVFMPPLGELSYQGTVEVKKDGACICRIDQGEIEFFPEEREWGEDVVTFGTGDVRSAYQISLYVPAANMHSTIHYFVSLLWIVFLYILLMVLIVSLLRVFLKKLNFISRMLALIDLNEDNQRIPGLGNDEIGALGRSINELLIKVEQQRREILQSETDRRLEERYALQFQMNPHLLFNSLHWLQLNMTGENAKIQKGIILLGEMYHYNLTGSDNASIGEEIQNAETYVKMMRMMKNNDIILEIHYPEEMESISIPRFTLQPVVENAIKHGMQANRPIRISIEFSWKNNGISICVRNDGIPIPPEKLAELNEELSSREHLSNGRKHIGMMNLARRLQLSYGENAVIELRNENNETMVSLFIPDER